MTKNVNVFYILFACVLYFMAVSVHPHFLYRYFPDLCFELLFVHLSCHFTLLHTWLHFLNDGLYRLNCKDTTLSMPWTRLFLLILRSNWPPLYGRGLWWALSWGCLSAFSNWVTAGWTLAYGRSVAVLGKSCEFFFFFFGNFKVALEHLHHIERGDKPVMARECFLWNFASATVNFSKHHHFPHHNWLQ